MRLRYTTLLGNHVPAEEIRYAVLQQEFDVAHAAGEEATADAEAWLRHRLEADDLGWKTEAPDSWEEHVRVPAILFDRDGRRVDRADVARSVLQSELERLNELELDPRPDALLWLRYRLIELGGPETHLFFFRDWHDSSEDENSELFALRDRIDGSAAKSITLERGVCLGNCPVYRVTLSEDGSAEWYGEAYVDRWGGFRGTFAPDTFAWLARFIDRCGFIDWRDAYFGMVLDLPRTTVTVEYDRLTKKVEQCASNEPLDFGVIVSMIDAVAERIEWVRDDRRLH